jgi:hypothetical protein
MQDLEIVGLIDEVDPPREEAKVAIAAAKGAGVRVRMITGDHAVTAAAIAKELGIEGRAVTGAEFGALSDAEAGGTRRGPPPMAGVPADRLITGVTHDATHVSTMSRLKTLVGATGLEPAVPTPRIVLPEWVAYALRGAAYVVGPRG